MNIEHVSVPRELLEALVQKWIKTAASIIPDMNTALGNRDIQMKKTLRKCAVELYIILSRATPDDELQGEFAECYISTTGLETLRTPGAGIATVGRAKTDYSHIPLFLHPKPSAPRVVTDGLSAWVGDMKTSAGMDYYVCVGFRDRSEYLTPNLYKIRGRAEFDVAEWNHLLGRGPKPDILAFDTEAAAPQAGES